MVALAGAFTGVTSPVAAADIVTSGMQLVTILAPIILIGLAIAFAPRFISLLKGTVGRGK